MVTLLSVDCLRLNRGNKAVLVIRVLLTFGRVVINVPIAGARIPTRVLILKPGTMKNST